MSDILARMRNLIGTTSGWAANDLVLGDGELGLERTTTGLIKIKVGNGVQAWSALAYYGVGIGAVGYKWKEFAVGSERVYDTDYTAPDHPIQVMIQCNHSTSPGVRALYVGVDTSHYVNMGHSGNAGNGQMDEQLTAIVPPGHKYRVHNDTMFAGEWCELRMDNP